MNLELFDTHAHLNTDVFDGIIDRDVVHVAERLGIKFLVGMSARFVPRGNVPSVLTEKDF